MPGRARVFFTLVRTDTYHLVGVAPFRFSTGCSRLSANPPGPRLRISGSLAPNVPFAFQFRARKGSGWALSNVAEGVSVDSAPEVRTDVMAGHSDLSGDTIVPDTVCRDYDDPATPEDEEGAFIVNIGFTTKSPALLFYEEVSGFVPDDDLTLENATAELIDRPYDYYLGYRVASNADAAPSSRLDAELG